jgi:LmbE family N-acetylglucosaminyl deacetylase
MKMFESKVVLVLCPHTDDEFGCGGTIARLIDEGSTVHYVAFSICEESVPPGWPKDILAHEARSAADVLGISAGRVTLFRYPVRHFPAKRQEILEDMIKLREQIKPSLVLLPSFDDLHQDHQVIAHEGFRAFKYSSLLGYELPMNTITFKHACFVTLARAHIERKVRALMTYKSQHFRPYVNEDFIYGLGRVRGTQAGVEYAEAFEVLRIIT